MLPVKFNIRFHCAVSRQEDGSLGPVNSLSPERERGSPHSKAKKEPVRGSRTGPGGLHRPSAMAGGGSLRRGHLGREPTG